MDRFSIGRRIREARKAQGLTQRQLGQRCDGLSHVAISNIESGMTNMPIDRLQRMANVLGKPVEWFLLDPREHDKETPMLQQPQTNYGPLAAYLTRYMGHDKNYPPPPPPPDALYLLRNLTTEGTTQIARVLNMSPHYVREALAEVVDAFNLHAQLTEDEAPPTPPAAPASPPAEGTRQRPPNSGSIAVDQTAMAVILQMPLGEIVGTTFLLAEVCHALLVEHQRASDPEMMAIFAQLRRMGWKPWHERVG